MFTDNLGEGRRDVMLEPKIPNSSHPRSAVIGIGLFGKIPAGAKVIGATDVPRLIIKFNRRRLVSRSAHPVPEPSSPDAAEPSLGPNGLLQAGAWERTNGTIVAPAKK